MTKQQPKLYENERIDFIVYPDLRIIQSEEVFSFSMDAVLLAHFAYLPIQKGNVIDLCTGNAAIPLLMSKRTKATIDAVEIQERLVDMASRSVSLNQLNEQIRIHHMDIKEIIGPLKQSYYDVVTCNPPYMPVTSGETHHNMHYALARHEMMCTLADVIRISSQLLKTGGKIAMVHRPNRLTDILTLMRQYKLEPKRIQFIHPRKEKEANMILVEGVLGGKPDVKMLPPLIVYTAKNEYTPEFEEAFYAK